MADRNNVEGRNPPLVSLATAAESLGVSVKTLRRRISDGTVRGYRVGRLIRVDLDELRGALLVEIQTTKRVVSTDAGY